VSHNDLKAENLLVDPEGRIWLIDLEKMRRHQQPQRAEERLLEDIGRLLHPRSWRRSCDAAERFRERLGREPAVAAAVARVQPKKHPLVQPQLLTRGGDQKLTIVVPAGEDAGNLPACLQSLRDIADEIILADDGLDGSVLELACRYCCRVIQRAKESVIEHGNRSLAAAAHPWVLVVARDEQVSPDLSKELQCLLTDFPSSDGYRIERRRMYPTHFRNYGLFRDAAPVRLFRRGLGAFVILRELPQIELNSERIGRLNSVLVCNNQRQLPERTAA
jgi:hypothetical protein